MAQWFELRWWKNYLRDKNEDEYLTWKRNYWKEILLKMGAGSRGGAPAGTLVLSAKTVCDLGCGPSGIFIALPQSKVKAVDPLVDEYEKQIPFFRKKDYPNVDFVQSTIEDFQAQQPFDFVFCLNVINHVQDIEKGFKKLNSLCKINGAVVLSIDAHNFPFFKHLFRLVPGDVLHPHQYDLKEYRSFLEKNGLKILKTELLKKEFFFNHYLLVAIKDSIS